MLPGFAGGPPTHPPIEQAGADHSLRRNRSGSDRSESTRGLHGNQQSRHAPKDTSFHRGEELSSKPPTTHKGHQTADGPFPDKPDGGAAGRVVKVASLPSPRYRSVTPRPHGAQSPGIREGAALDGTSRVPKPRGTTTPVTAHPFDTAATAGNRADHPLALGPARRRSTRPRAGVVRCVGPLPRSRVRCMGMTARCRRRIAGGCGRR